MNRAVSALIAIAAITAPVSPALAKGPDHCPPGLAKKSPACIPPGLAKKQQYLRYDGERYRDYRRGDRIPEGYERIHFPRDYGLPEADYGTDYYIVNDVIFRASRETQEIIDLYRAVDAVLN